MYITGDQNPRALSGALDLDASFIELMAFKI